MRVQCSTCLELLAPGDDLTCTPCGHVFHMACVLQWFESKKNCPQVNRMEEKLGRRSWENFVKGINQKAKISHFLRTSPTAWLKKKRKEKKTGGDT